MPHAEGAETATRAAAILGTFLMNVGFLVFAGLFYQEAQMQRTFNLFGLTLGYGITMGVLALLTAAAYAMDYHWRMEDEQAQLKSGQAIPVDSSASAYVAMLRSPRYVWSMYTWAVVTAVALGGSLAVTFAYYHFLSGTTLAPPVDVTPFAMSSENLRWMNVARFDGFICVFCAVIGIYALHVYALRTEEPIGSQLVTAWSAARGYEFWSPEIVASVGAGMMASSRSK